MVSNHVHIVKTNGPIGKYILIQIVRYQKLKKVQTWNFWKYHPKQIKENEFLEDLVVLLNTHPK